jgi:hypothetical protein
MFGILDNAIALKERMDQNHSSHGLASNLTRNTSHLHSVDSASKALKQGDIYLPSWNMVSITFLLVTRDNRSKPLVLQILYTVRVKMSESKTNRATHASPRPASWHQVVYTNVMQNLLTDRSAMDFEQVHRTSKKWFTSLLYMFRSNQFLARWSYCLKTVQTFPPRKNQYIQVHKGIWTRTEAAPARATRTIISQASRCLLRP